MKPVKREENALKIGFGSWSLGISNKNIETNCLSLGAAETVSIPDQFAAA